MPDVRRKYCMEKMTIRLCPSSDRQASVLNLPLDFIHISIEMADTPLLFLMKCIHYLMSFLTTEGILCFTLGFMVCIKFKILEKENPHCLTKLAQKLDNPTNLWVLLTVGVLFKATWLVLYFTDPVIFKTNTAQNCA